MGTTSPNTPLLLCISSGLQMGAHAPVAPWLPPEPTVGALQVPNAQLISLQNRAWVWASPFPSEALLCKGYFWGAAYAELWQSNRTENLPLSCHALGIWPVIIVTIKESSAAVIPIEKDGNNSLPLLFASAKYDNCFFRFYFVNYINYWV